MNAQDIHYLKLLAREYPSPQAASAEIINLTAILNLPKGTEHFMSDIHGEHEAFLHILNNGSGAVADKIDQAFEGSLVISERRALAALIYYPREKLIEAKATVADLYDWYCVMLRRLIAVCRLSTSKYSRSKVRKALPREFAYIMEELLNTAPNRNQDRYYDNIIRAIIDTGSADTFIVEMATLIKRMTVDVLHIVGDIFDRGPHADVILDHLMQHHNVDIQWGNHDVMWMGAAAGSDVCIATAVRNCVQYDNLDMLENGYGINLLPLAVFSTEQYGDGDASVFKPRKLPEEPFKPRDLNLYARMHKAISVILFKLEGQVIAATGIQNVRDRDMPLPRELGDRHADRKRQGYPSARHGFPHHRPGRPDEAHRGEERSPDGAARFRLHTQRAACSSMRASCISVGSVYRCYKRQPALPWLASPATGTAASWNLNWPQPRLSGRDFSITGDKIRPAGLFLRRKAHRNGRTAAISSGSSVRRNFPPPHFFFPRPAGTSRRSSARSSRIRRMEGAQERLL